MKTLFLPTPMKIIFFKEVNTLAICIFMVNQITLSTFKDNLSSSDLEVLSTHFTTSAS
ncbi:Uncharacterized protein dnm_077220 [Desulfonema magnum]|uniref:Uncharacterized protein n=1 Tax=Desulfonema magnum TaxID=45655 RepID=A0A975GS44_9BACT|nr:Uncharacterized protein dnm_077220 [Desulfonema magnum]